MKLQTPVTDNKCKVNISFKDSIMMLGSCFSDSVGLQLTNYGFDICINPFGTIYNPESILASVRRLISREQFTAEDCIEIGAGDSRICSFSHHTSFARGSVEEFLENANARLNEAADFFCRCNKVVLILGTSWCFRNNGNGEVVSNCLKRLAGEFTRERLSANETTACLCRIMELCRMAEGMKMTQHIEFVPKQFIFTVSPIRHFKDGAHGNQISKAGLLLGIEDAIGTGCDYFPSYEIMMDELRDYRFYAEDMCHPTAQAVNYIRERFLGWALDPSEHSLLEENIRKFKRNSHREK
jgi:hypothetical protein